jgi:uncharacterized membrane protein YkgB
MTLKNKSLISLLSISISIVYFWFGFLKFFPELSPAEYLAKTTIDLLSFNLIPSNISILLLAFWECIIAVCLIFIKTRRIAVILALVHMLGTFTPFILLPLETHTTSFYSLTLVGQYIIKNIVLISALLVVYPNKEKSVYY